MFIEHKISPTIVFDSILQILSPIKINFESYHGDSIFTSIIILVDVLNLKQLQLWASKIRNKLKYWNNHMKVTGSIF